MKVQYGKIRPDFSVADMEDMRNKTPKPDVYVQIDGFYYFRGIDGMLWQTDSLNTFPDITTWNTMMWTEGMYGEELDSTDEETENVIMTNFRAMAELSLKSP